MISNKKENEVKYKDEDYIFQEYNEDAFKSFKQFLNTPEFKAEKGDTEMNYWENGGSFGLYKIPTDNVDQYFQYYDKCRINKLRLYYVERYHKEASLVHDYDIYQKDKTDCMNKFNIYKIVEETCKCLVELVDFSDIVNERSIYLIILKRHMVEWDEDKQAWKNGLHILIPSIRLEKASRKLFILKLKQRKNIEKDISKYLIPSEVNNLIDVAAAWVPQLLFGSAKKNKQPYLLNNIYKMNINSNGDFVIENDSELMTYNNNISSSEDNAANRDEHKINLALEFCSSVPGKYIKTHTYKLKRKYEQDLDRLNLKSQTREHRDDDEIDLCNMYNALNYLTISNHNAEYLKEVLDLLPKKFYDKYNLWFKVIYILANTCIVYKPLAKWFSRKSSKWQSSEYFDVKWNEAMHGQRYSLHVTHIYKWARKYNRDKFLKLDNDTAYRLVQKNAFDSIVEGALQHDHFAKLLDILLKNKYVSDSLDSANKKFLWYEFIFPEDKAKPGQLYKWAKIENPTNMYLYISEKIPNLIKQVMENIKNQMANAEDDKDKIKYYKTIIVNLRKSGRNLSCNTFREHVVKAASMRFLKPSFSKELNMHQLTFGVGNGVLLFKMDGSKPSLVKQFNDLKVSHYTETLYVPFDPEDPLTQKILLALRTAHPDDETDVYEYRMGFHASSLDNRPREALFFCGTGPGRNGKSFGSELHKNMLGDTYGRAMPVSFLTQPDGSADAASPVTMCLKVARYCMYSEGPACVAFYLPKIKRLTGGDTFSSRGLYAEEENFNPRCCHIAFSNHDFEIPVSDIAIWERIRYIIFPMVFKNEWDYDPTDKYQRIKDRSLNPEFIQRSDVKSRYLSIMSFYHMKLMHHWDGVVDKIPHPTVEQTTMNFRIEQDTITRFAQMHLIKVSPNDSDALSSPPSIRLLTIAKKYAIWFSTNIKEKSNLNIGFIKKTIGESIFKKYIETVHGIKFLKSGYRLKESEVEPLQKGEKMVIQLENKKTDTSVHNKKNAYYKPETPLEFLDRVKREWAELEEWDKQVKSKENSINVYDDYEDEGEDSDDEKYDKIDTNQNESVAKAKDNKYFNVSESVISDILAGNTPYKNQQNNDPLSGDEYIIIRSDDDDEDQSDTEPVYTASDPSVAMLAWL